VLALREVHIDDVYIYMVMDLCDGGELFDRVARGGGLGEDLARYYFKQIVAGLAYCHEQQVWHRDLKLENLLMVEKSTDSLVKIADFGLSKDAAEMKTVDTSCGTVSYMAPEICLLQPGQIYNEAKADIWSLGVILYVMRCCAYPFGHDGRGGERTDIVFARAMRRRWKNPGQLESKCSSSLQDLIKSMLSVEPDKRPTLAEIQQHPWFQAGKPYIPPPPNRTQGRHGTMASPQMSPHWQWPSSSAPAPEPSPGSWDSAVPKDAANSGPPLLDEEFSLGAGQFMNTPPRRSHSLITRSDHDDAPREFCLMVESRDEEFADVFANGRISCELTATTTEELQSGLADMLGLPDVLHIWYTDPTFRVPAVILDLAVLPHDALVVVKRRDDTNDHTQQSVKSPKQDPIIKRLRKVRCVSL
jgi:serine/threonine protein kinase